MLESLFGFILIITPLVFFHELGHFAFARYSGVVVDVFSVGFGPEIFGYTDRQKTRWRLALIPLGGYVKIKGEALDSKRGEAGTLAGASLLQRMSIIAAGPMANIILALGILWAVNVSYGVYTQSPYLETGIGRVAENSPASRLGLQTGDVITKLNGASIQAFGDIVQAMQTVDDTPIEIHYIRGDSSYQALITPALSDNRYILGVTAAEPVRKNLNLWDSLIFSSQQLIWFGGQILEGLGGLFIGAVAFDELGGPIKIAQYSGDVLSVGAEQLLLFAAMLSVNLAIINLFPIPGLDGGHLLWLVVEGVIRRPPPAHWVHLTNNIGILFVLGLILLVSVKDVYQIFL